MKHQSNESELNRRSALKAGMSLLGSASLLVGARVASAQSCGLTPPQTEGPFYPIEDGVDEDADLTFVRGRTKKAKGKIVYIEGVVQDQNCVPVAGALVEIWQACESGRYNHPSDPNTEGELDPNFQYWGDAITDAKGRYLFKTIIPGSYPAAVGWRRPPHIHYKVTKVGYHELTTQMYFAGDALNANDRILRAIPAAERDRVVVNFEPTTQVGREQPSQSGVFNLNIREV